MINQTIECTFKNNLKRIRKEKKLSQEALGDLLGVTQVTVQRWESGERTPHMEDLTHITQKLECNLEELFGLDSGKKTSPLIGFVPQPAPLDRSARLDTTNPNPIVIYREFGDLAALIVKDTSMNKVALEGQAIIVDFADNDKEKLNGAHVLAEAGGYILFRQYLALPDRLIAESNMPIPPITGDFKILGRVLGVQHEFF